MSARVPFVALCACLCLVPACNKSGGGKAVVPPDAKPRVAIVTNNTADFWSICESGATKGANDFKCDLTFRQPPTDAVADQMTIVKDLVRTGVNGLAVSVIRPEDQAQDLRAIAEQTHFITMDNDAPNSGRACYIGVDNFEAGKAAGRLVKKAIPDGGTVTLFVGNESSKNAVDRISGVLSELAGKKVESREPAQFGPYHFIGVTTDGADAKVAQDKAKDVLEKLRGTPNFCCVGLYAYNPKALLLAAKSKGLVGKVKIVGFDEDVVTLQGIIDGEVVGTVVQDPFGYGYKSVEVLAALARGDKSKAVDTVVPHRVVTKDGGPTETHGGVEVVNLPAAEFRAKAQAEVDSVKGK